MKSPVRTPAMPDPIAELRAVFAGDTQKALQCRMRGTGEHWTTKELAPLFVKKKVER